MSLGPKSSFTYLFEAGGGACSVSMAGMQNILSSNHRACAYDRLGYGWSDSAMLPHTIQDYVTELHSLLELAGEQGPYVMIGHSVGGQCIQKYASAYPTEVIGLVMIDSYSSYLELLQPVYGWTDAQVKSMQDQTIETCDIARAFSVTPILRWVTSSLAYNSSTPDYEKLNGAYSATYGTYRNWQAQWNDVANSDFTESVLQDITLGNKTVVFIAAGMTVNATCQEREIPENTKQCDDALKSQAAYLNGAKTQLARLSTNSHLYICPAPCDHGVATKSPSYITNLVKQHFE